ncbi:putative aconitate hydratase, mitochondrial, partial [Teratosphaeria destructans]
ALQPRYLGGRVIVAKSFARIHETNLKKQGVVPLTFADEADYARLAGGDVVSTEGLYETLRNGGKGRIELVVRKEGTGETFRVKTRFNLSPDQCGFILAGSALNVLAKRGVR